MTELEELYKKIGMSSCANLVTEWAKTVTLDDARKTTPNLIPHGLLRSIQREYNKYYRDMLDTYITDNMNDTKIPVGTRVRHTETGTKYILYGCSIKEFKDISKGDCYDYVMTTGEMFSSKYIEPLTEEEIWADINAELSDLKIGNILTWEHGNRFKPKILVLDVSDNDIIAVRLNDLENAPLFGIGKLTKPPHDVCLITPPILTAIQHKDLFAHYEYDDAYCYEIGVPSIERDLPETLKISSNVVTIDVCDCYTRATRDVRRAHLLTIPRDDIIDYLCEYYYDDGNPLSMRKMNIYVKEINTKVIYEYLTSVKERTIEDIYQELTTKDNE